jgi:hypothetical protein
MKTWNFSIRPISILLVAALFFQSCNAYYRTPKSLEDVAGKNAKVKMVRTNGTKVILKKVEHTENGYVGFMKVHKSMTAVPLDPNDIQSLRLQNKPLSTLATIGIVVLVVAVVGLVIAAISYGSGTSYSFGDGTF